MRIEDTHNIWSEGTLLTYKGNWQGKEEETNNGRWEAYNTPSPHLLQLQDRVRSRTKPWGTPGGHWWPRSLWCGMSGGPTHDRGRWPVCRGPATLSATTRHASHSSAARWPSDPVRVGEKTTITPPIFLQWGFRLVLPLVHFLPLMANYFNEANDNNLAA